MNHILSSLASAAALCLGGTAQAGLVTFDHPSEVIIDGAAASYTEAGFVFSGSAGLFGPLDTIGSAGTPGLFVLAGSELKLTTTGGGTFSLAGFDFGLNPFDPSTDPSPFLSVQGLLADNSTVSLSLALGSLTGTGFNQWDNLRSVTFVSANAGFVLDSISAVPEPGSLALIALGLVGLAATRKRSAWSGLKSC